MQLLRKSLDEGAFLLSLEAGDLETILSQTLNHLVERGQLPAEHRETVLQALLEREEQASTAIGRAVAVPHAYLNVLTEPVIAFVRLARPLNLGAPDGVPTQYVFVLVGPEDSAAEHLDTLTAIARLMSDDEFRFEAGEAQSALELIESIDRFEARIAPPPPPAPPPKVPEGMEFTGRPAGGLIRDIRRRLPHYVDDFRDGLHPKCVASILFLFFACLAPAVTFGGVMAELTDNHIGAVEMIAASAFCGTVYALVAGQPLIILGGTGPLLIFTVILFRLCTDLQIPFLPAYACVGLWTGAFVLLMAVTDSSALMRHFTRFTDEIFAGLISLIFIYEAIKALVHIFGEVDDLESVSHDKALLSLILALGTFYIASNLSRFRRSRYLMPKVREFLADFGSTISLAAMTLVAISFRGDVTLDVLDAPEQFGPTLEGRSWVVNPFHADLPPWVWFAAALPGLFAAVLLYLDQNITARLINNPDHKLYKGVAYHLDLGVVGVLVAVCSIFGLPWLVAATVRSLNHLRSLATSEEVVVADSELRERIIHVRENRVTGLSIHLLIGLSLLLIPLLKVIPMAVLYGIFLYMGVVSMKGNQFFERLNLWPMDSSLYPSSHYMRRVPTPTIHKFTGLQLVCLAILWVVKTGPPAVAILFPLFIAVLVPVRMLAARFFPPEALEALDAEETPSEEQTDWGAG